VFWSIDLSWVGKPIELCLIDLLMCGDNALVIAIASQTLPLHRRRQAMILGIFGAVFIRFVLTATATIAFNMPGLKIGGAILLLLIALKLTADESDERDPAASQIGPDSPSDDGLMSAVMVILSADVLMSLDNTVALAAVAQGNIAWLALGLALSIPALLLGATIMASLIARYPTMITLGGMFLGWVAGGMATGDSLLQSAVQTQAQSLPYTLPPLIALYVFLQSRTARHPGKAVPRDRGE